MVAEEIRRAAQAAPLARLCEVAAALWKAFGAGGVSEAEAEELSGLIEARRAVEKSSRRENSTSAAGRVAQSATLSPAAVASAKLANPRRPQRPPIRSAAIERRRRLAASGPMPPALAARYTTAEQAALKVISDDVRSSGACMLPIDAIAARAGVSRTSVQNAIRRACDLGMLERQERRRAYDRSLPSVLRVVDREWLAWLKRGPKGGGLNDLSTTDTRDSQRGFAAAESSKGCRGAEFDLGRSASPRIRAGRGAGRAMR